MKGTFSHMVFIGKEKKFQNNKMLVLFPHYLFPLPMKRETLIENFVQK